MRLRRDPYPFVMAAVIAAAVLLLAVLFVDQFAVPREAVPGKVEEQFRVRGYKFVAGGAVVTSAERCGVHVQCGGDLLIVNVDPALWDRLKPGTRVSVRHYRSLIRGELRDLRVEPQ
jgi:hypothetical protein